MDITRLNMVSWIFYYYIVLQTFISAILIIHDWDDHYLINKIHDKQIIRNAYYSVMYALISLPLAMWITTFLWGKKSAKTILNKYLTKSIEPILSPKDSYVRATIYLLSLISIMSVIYVFLVIGQIPLLEVIKGRSAVALAIMRIEASREFAGNQYIRNIFAIMLTPMLSYIMYGYWRMTKNRLDGFIFFILFFFSFLITTYNLAKSGFVTYLLGFLFLNVLINGRVKRKAIIRFGVFTIILLVFVYMVLANEENVKLLFSYNQGIIGRIILTQSAGTYFSFDLFPSKLPHIGFNSLSNVISNIFSFSHEERSARLIMEQIVPEAMQLGTAGVMNSFFIAEAWSNFGILGVIVSPFIVGFEIQTIYILILNLKKTPILLSLLAYFSTNTAITGGFNDYIYNPKTIFLLFILITIYIFSNSLKILNIKESER